MAPLNHDKVGIYCCAVLAPAARLFHAFVAKCDDGRALDCSLTETDHCNIGLRQNAAKSPSHSVHPLCMAYFTII